MAKEYGTPIRPYEQDSNAMQTMCDHTGWSKSELVHHMVARVWDEVMSGPGQPKPGGN